MGTIFILWVDDEPENIELYGKGLSDTIKKLTGKEFDVEIKDYRTYNNGVLHEAAKAKYQLIITDLNLLKGDLGATFINQLKENRTYKDMLIYSGDDRALEKVTRGLDGIFIHGTLKGLKEKIVDVTWQVAVKEMFAYTRFEDNRKK